MKACKRYQGQWAEMSRAHWNVLRCLAKERSWIQWNLAYKPDTYAHSANRSNKLHRAQLLRWGTNHFERLKTRGLMQIIFPRVSTWTVRLWGWRREVKSVAQARVERFRVLWKRRSAARVSRAPVAIREEKMGSPTAISYSQRFFERERLSGMLSWS